MKQLPVGIQDFAKLRDNDSIYVDKTEAIYRLIEMGGYLFFARPRRFGKSLTISTLNEIFTGNKRLFSGLWIEDKIDWQPRPVIRLDLSKLAYKDFPLGQVLEERVQEIADDYHITLTGKGAKQKFVGLLAAFSKQGRKAAILIDEYDAPIIDCLGDDTKVQEHISILKPFYRTLKDSDADIHFAFITGVSKFGKVSIFSDLNNLNDVTIHPKTLTLCGYTQQELEYTFKEYIDTAAQQLGQSSEELLAGIKHWYNGYMWDGKPENSVYNPFSLLNFFDKPEFKGYWFETGTPTFLTKLVHKAKIPAYQLEKMASSAFSISAADVSDISAVAMLFQTGYLTIHDKDSSIAGTYYTLGYPNEEVRQAFTKCMLGEYLSASPNDKDVTLALPLRAAIDACDWTEVQRLIKSLFASVPYHITDTKEAYFHSIMHIMLTLTGWRVFSEVASNRGRMDTVLENAHTVYIFEFKIGESANAALAQIRANGYPERYAKAGKRLLLIGVSYSLRSRNVKEWKVEEITKINQ